jgi:hypothetical protein
MVAAGHEGATARDHMVATGEEVVVARHEEAGGRSGTSGRSSTGVRREKAAV